MKIARLHYYPNFPWAPISHWVGACSTGYVAERSAGGQWKTPRSVSHPFMTQRRRWCLLAVDFNGVLLLFSTPQELDHFLDVMSKNPLPSGWSLIPGLAYGRPNQHWLSRLPKEAKSWKFRQAVCRFLRQDAVVETFRAFYRSQPVQYEFDGVYGSPQEARRALQQGRGTVHNSLRDLTAG